MRKAIDELTASSSTALQTKFLLLLDRMQSIIQILLTIILLFRQKSQNKIKDNFDFHVAAGMYMYYCPHYFTILLWMKRYVQMKIK